MCTFSFFHNIVVNVLINQSWCTGLSLQTVLKFLIALFHKLCANAQSSCLTISEIRLWNCVFSHLLQLPPQTRKKERRYTCTHTLNSNQSGVWFICCFYFFRPQWLRGHIVSFDPEILVRLCSIKFNTHRNLKVFITDCY